MKTARFLCLLALASLASAQTLEVTTKQGRKFYSLPDTKGVLVQADMVLNAPNDATALLKLAQAQIS
ncbi:MAG: hypothetical protein ABSF12_00665, partial [Bryobacteraceae bacterium]